MWPVNLSFKCCKLQLSNHSLSIHSKQHGKRMVGDSADQTSSVKRLLWPWRCFNTNGLCRFFFCVFGVRWWQMRVLLPCHRHYNCQKPIHIKFHPWAFCCLSAPLRNSTARIEGAQKTFASRLFFPFSRQQKEARRFDCSRQQTDGSQ